MFHHHRRPERRRTTRRTNPPYAPEPGRPRRKRNRAHRHGGVVPEHVPCQGTTIIIQPCHGTCRARRVALHGPQVPPPCRLVWPCSFFFFPVVLASSGGSRVGATGVWCETRRSGHACGGSILNISRDTARSAIAGVTPPFARRHVTTSAWPIDLGFPLGPSASCFTRTCFRLGRLPGLARHSRFDVVTCCHVVAGVAD